MVNFNSAKMDRVWLILILIYQNGPFVTKLILDLRKWAMVDHFEPWITKEDLFDPFGPLFDL